MSTVSPGQYQPTRSGCMHPRCTLHAARQFSLDATQIFPSTVQNMSAVARPSLPPRSDKGATNHHPPPLTRSHTDVSCITSTLHLLLTSEPFGGRLYNGLTFSPCLSTTPAPIPSGPTRHPKIASQQLSQSTLFSPFLPERGWSPSDGRRHLPEIPHVER